MSDIFLYDMSDDSHISCRSKKQRLVMRRSGLAVLELKTVLSSIRGLVTRTPWWLKSVAECPYADPHPVLAKFAVQVLCNDSPIPFLLDEVEDCRNGVMDRRRE